MKLVVKMLTGFSFTVDDLDPADTIHELKGRVYEKEGYLPASQRIADGASKSSLDNGVTLEEAGFKDGDTAHLLVAVKVLKEEENAKQADWRKKRPIEQRLQHLLETGLCSDVLLQVKKSTGEWEDIRAHRTILTQASSVFETLCEPTPHTRNPRVKVTDISSEVLWQLLRCIYCGPLKLDVKNMVTLYNAAVNYRLTEIIDKCEAFLAQNLNSWSSGDLLTLLYTLTTGEHEDLAHTIVSHISKSMKKYILQPEFTRLSHQSLAWILESDTMYGCSEIELYRACVGWARVRCEKDGVKPTGPACRQTLGHCLHSIRFPAMTLEEFAEVSTGLGILTADERADVYDYLVLKREAKKPTAFPTEARRRRTVQQFKRFSGVCSEYGKANHAIDILVDKAIELTAISTYGAYDKTTPHDVQVEVRDNKGAVLGAKSTRIVSSPDTDIHHVNLDQPVSLKANVRYTLSERRTGPTVSLLYGPNPLSLTQTAGVRRLYGRGGRDTYTVGGDGEVKTNIKLYQSVISGFKSITDQGQIPGFLFR